MAANISDSEEYCFIHFLDEKSDLKRVLQKVTDFCKIIEQRNDWLSFKNDDWLSFKNDELSTSESIDPFAVAQCILGNEGKHKPVLLFRGITPSEP